MIRPFFKKLYPSSTGDMIKAMAKIAAAPALDYWETKNGKGKGRGKGKESIMKEKEKKRKEKKRKE